MEEAKQIWTDITSFHWFNRFVNWLIISGGVIAQSAFMLATLYVTMCVVAHQLLTWIFWFRPQTIPVLNQVSVLIFSWIPELIVAAAMTTSIQHWKTAISGKYKWSYVWAIAYTIPTVVFLIMTIVTILSFASLQEISADRYQVSGMNLNARVLFGWFYGVVGMLFESVGKPGYAELIAELRAQNKALVNQHHDQVEKLNDQLDEAGRLLQTSKTEKEKLQIAMQKDHESTLEELPQELVDMIKNDVKTLSLPDLIAITGIAKRKITKAMADHKLTLHSRNKNLILMSSVIAWLKEIGWKRDQSTSEWQMDGHSKETIQLNDFPELLV